MDVNETMITDSQTDFEMLPVDFLCVYFYVFTALVHTRAEQLLRSSVQPYINSILEALMEPASRGFSEVRDILFREMIEVSKNTLNDGGKEALGKVRRTEDRTFLKCHNINHTGRKIMFVYVCSVYLCFFALLFLLGDDFEIHQLY